jgi:hypothetical protein
MRDHWTNCGKDGKKTLKWSRMWTEFSWLRTGRHFEHGNELSSSYTIISSQEGLYFMGLVS